MGKRIIALILVLAISLSFVTFADVPATNEVISEVYAYDFYFRDENSNVIKTNTAGDITAETYAYLTGGDVDELDVTLSIFVFYNNKIIAAQSKDETITNTAVKITTPAVTVSSDIKDNVAVKAILTLKDFSALLAPVAQLGSSNADIEKITVGEYEIFPQDDIYEYNIKRFFKAEEITPELRAHTSDLSALKAITYEENNGVTEYTVKTVSCDGSSSAEYKINVTPIIAEETSLAGIEVNGKTIEDFAPDKKEYSIAVTDDKIPEITAYQFSTDAEVTVENATELPGTTSVKVSYNNMETTYKINFVKPVTVSLTSDTDNASHPFGYQYRESETKVSDGTRNSAYLVTTDADYLTAGNYVCYAAFDTSSLGNVDIVYPIDINTTQKYTYTGNVEIYNSTFDDSTGIKDEYAEIKNKTAKLLGTFSAAKNNNTISVNKDDLTICQNGNIVLIFTKQYDETSASKNIIVNEVKLNITYLPKNLSKLTEERFDVSLIEKPSKPETVKGDAFVTAKSEWADDNGNILLKIDLNAQFPYECENKNVLVKVVKPEKNEIDNITVFEKYAYIYNSTVSTGGIFNESFKFLSDAGKYTIVLSCNGYEKNISCTVDMPSSDKMNELISGLKENTYNQDTLSTFLSSNISALSLDNSLFASFTEETRKLIAQYVIDNIESYTASGFSNTLNEASILLGINKNETDQTVLKVLETDEISELIESNENFEDYKNGGKNEILPLLKNGTYKTYNDISNAVYEELFIILLKNCSDKDDITSVIDRYRNYLSAGSYMKYSGMTDEDREIVNAKIILKLSEIDTISELEEIIILNLPDKIAITEPSKTIHTYGFNFKNESNADIKEIGVSSKIKAEVYAELSDPLASDINLKFVVMAYNGDKLLSSSVMPYTVKKDAQLISTGYINIDSNVTLVKAVIISEDEKDMLSKVGTLSSNDARIKDIYVGNYKLPLKEEVTEYSLTRYFDESEPVKLRAYAEDFSSKIQITETNEDGIIFYTVKSTSSDGTNEEIYKISLKALSVTDTSLAGIELDGKAIEGFSPEINEYYIGVKGKYIPEITAYKFDNKAQCEVINATSIPGTTVINVTNGNNLKTYKINFLPVLNKVISYSDFICRSGNNSSQSEYTVRASSEPMSGGSSKVLYYLFDFNSLGNIGIRDAKISGTATTDIKLYFYNSSYSSIDDIKSHTESNFKEIYDGLVSYLGEYKFGKGETANVSLDVSNMQIKDNKVMLMVRKKYGDTNAEDYGQYTGVTLNLEYVEKPDTNVTVCELSDKGFDISLLDKGELTYLSTKEPSLSINTVWKGETPKLNLLLNTSFLKESANQNVYLKILRPDISEEDDKSFNEKYAYMGTFALDENGGLETSFVFDETSGNYKIVLKCENSEKVLEETFDVPQSDKIVTLINNLKDGLFTKDTLYTYLINNKSELALDNSTFCILNEISSKNVCDYIINNISSYTADGFNDVMSEALVIRGINSLESNENVEKLLTENSIYSDLSSDKNYNDYTSLSDKTALLNMIKTENFATLNDAKEALYKNLLIVKLNGITSYMSVEGLIDSYSDYITSSVYSSYSYLSYDDRTAVNKKVAEVKSLITNITTLEIKIDEFIKNLSGNSGETILPSGQGSNSGGGGLGNVTTSAPEILATATMNFYDVSDDFWGYSAIKTLYDKKIISGKSENYFCPNDNVTRAEFTKMLVVSMNIEGNNLDIKFEDVNAGEWYYNYVALAVANGIIQGMNDTAFAPNISISRQDASVMINRILKLEQTSEELFDDDEMIADYAKSAVYALKENDVIKGYNGNFNPLGNLTRAEAAQLISNILNLSIGKE